MNLCGTLLILHKRKWRGKGTAVWTVRSQVVRFCLKPSEADPKTKNTVMQATKVNLLYQKSLLAFKFCNVLVAKMLLFWSFDFTFCADKLLLENVKHLESMLCLIIALIISEYCTRFHNPATKCVPENRLGDLGRIGTRYFHNFCRIVQIKI